MAFWRMRNIALALLISLSALCCKETSDPEVVQNDQLPEVSFELPVREGPRPQTTDQVPHVQIGVELIPEVHEEMIRKIYAIPGVEDRPSAVRSWRGLWISEAITIKITRAIIAGREFAHIHDDGSLHIFLEPDRADEAVEKGWATYHPNHVSGDARWRGFIMLYTPQTFDELDVVIQLIREGYDYVTGDGVKSRD